MIIETIRCSGCGHLFKIRMKPSYIREQLAGIVICPKCHKKLLIDKEHKHLWRRWEQDSFSYRECAGCKQRQVHFNYAESQWANIPNYLGGRPR